MHPMCHSCRTRETWPDASHVSVSVCSLNTPRLLSSTATHMIVHTTMLLRSLPRQVQLRAAHQGVPILAPPTRAIGQNAPSTSDAEVATSVYVHLPFCKRKCWYCDFPVEAVGSKPPSDRVQDRMQRYVSMVCAEIAACTRQGSEPLQTVYFGGGTPSLVPPPLIESILAALDHRFGISAGAEITLEADPGTFDAAKLTAYTQIGVNRLSVGVQSFQQELLEACGRAHSLDDVHHAIDHIHNCQGVRSWSLDLISGLPHLTLPAWEASLEAAVKARPTHISVYDLQVEEGTPFARWYQPGSRPLPEEEEAADMYAAASRILSAAGFEHYEVSNYAQPGHRSRHNQIYWSGAPYYGFGLGAASYLLGRRFSRPATMKAYTAWLDTFTASLPEQAVPGADMEPQSKADRMLDEVMLRLRTADGLDLNTFANRYGLKPAAMVKAALERHKQDGNVLEHRPTPAQQAAAPDQVTQVLALPTFRLKDPHGFLMSNTIISDVFAALTPS